MSIDFSGAPKDATHYKYTIASGLKWFKLYRGTAQIWCDGAWWETPFTGIGVEVRQILGRRGHA